MGLIKDAIGGTVGGLTSIASGIIGSGKRKREERAAKREFDAAEDRNEKQMDKQLTKSGKFKSDENRKRILKKQKL